MAFSLCGRCGIASNASRFERARRRGIEKAAGKEVVCRAMELVDPRKLKGQVPARRVSRSPKRGERSFTTRRRIRGERRGGGRLKGHCVPHPPRFFEGESSVHRLGMYGCT